MTTWTSKLIFFADVVGQIINKIYHYERPDVLPARFAVWQENGQREGSLYAENVPGEQVADISLDYFTQTEFDPVIDQIQEAFILHGWPFELQTVLYEDETRLIHYTWGVQVADNGQI